MAKAGELYEQDFFLWTKEQAAALRLANARTEVTDVLRDSPSLRREVDDLIAEQLIVAAELASADLSQHGEPAHAVHARLEKRGFTAEQVIGDWFPDPPA
jgi:hypothetical protein